MRIAKLVFNPNKKLNKLPLSNFYKSLTTLLLQNIIVMRNLFFALFISTITLLYSCKENDKTEISNARILERDFENATKTIEKYNNFLLSSLKEKAVTSATSLRGALWLAKAEEIKKNIDNFKKEIDSYKTQLKKEANLHFENGIEVFEENNKAPVNKIFITEKKSNELISSWEVLNSNLMLVDEALKKEFENKIEKIKIANNEVEKETLQKFTNRFTNITTMEALVILSSIENNLIITENHLINFCYNNVGVVGGCNFGGGPYFFVNQSINKVQKGEKILITAGIVEFITKSKPILKFDDKLISPINNGIAKYEIVTTSVVGKYKIPVEVNFTDENGKKCAQTKIIEYEVVK